MYKESIGIIGGFGGYATLGFFQRLLEVFATGKERDYPHIYMDNNFTMPSRTRALLFMEDYEIVVHCIADSLRKMYQGGVEHIILVCGTAHAFLDDVFEIVPETKDRVLNIIDILGEKMSELDVEEALVIGAEGVLKTCLYSKKLSKYGIKIIEPNSEYYEEIRYFIEMVKQNNFSKEGIGRFVRFIENFGTRNIILGCTEFPQLVKEILSLDLSPESKDILDRLVFYDPLEAVLEELKRILI